VPGRKAKLNAALRPDSPIVRGAAFVLSAVKCLFSIEERMELIKSLAISTLLIAVLHGGTRASAQMTCSVTREEAKGSGGNLLSGLIEDRLSVMTDVARSKWNNGSAIEDPVREQQLLADVAGKAQALGISAEWAQHFFRFQIEAAKEVQYCLFARWTAARQQPFPAVQDLRTVIRPRLDQLTVQILQELATEWPELSKRGSAEQNALLSAQSSNEIATRLALLPLSDGSLQAYRHLQTLPSRR
jgi:chorismate mutase-like protein